MGSEPPRPWLSSRSRGARRDVGQCRIYPGSHAISPQPLFPRFADREHLDLPSRQFVCGPCKRCLGNWAPNSVQQRQKLSRKGLRKALCLQPGARVPCRIFERLPPHATLTMSGKAPLAHHSAPHLSRLGEGLRRHRQPLRGFLPDPLDRNEGRYSSVARVSVAKRYWRNEDRGNWTG